MSPKSTSSFRIADSVSATLSRWKARLPVSTSYKMQPSEKKSVAAVNDSARLLGGHIADRPDGRACSGQRRSGSLVVVQGEAAGQTEVQNLQDALRRDEQIVRLEIAMDD